MSGRRSGLVAVVFVALALVAVAALGSRWSLERHPADTSAADAGAARAAAGPRFVARFGTTRSGTQSLAYRFRWTSTQEGALAERSALAGRITGEVAVAGTLLVSVTAGEGGSRVVAKLVDVRVAQWKVGELDLTNEGFGGGLAFLEADAEGVLHELAFAADTAPAERLLLRAVLTHSVHRAPFVGGARSARERTTIGTADADFVWSARELQARRTRYLTLDAVPFVAPYAQDLRSHASWSFSDDGAPRVVREVERVVLRGADGTRHFASDLSFELELTVDPRTISAGGSPTAGLAREPLDAIESPEARRERLVRRVDGLTEARVLDRVAIAAGGGGPETDAKLLFRATGLLLLEPTFADRLADRLLAPNTAASGDELVADLLTFAGDEASQAALRRALVDPRARNKAIYPLLVQRLGLVAAPSPATAQLCLSLVSEAPEGTDLQIGAHYAMGAVAGRLVRGGDEEGAAPLLRELEARLARASTDAARVHALRAMGNAGVPRHAALVVAPLNTGSANAEVRRAAADATRAFLDVGTRDAAFVLASDPDAQVAEAAVRALGERPLAAEDRGRLARLARDGRIPFGATAAVVEVMRTQPPPEAEARATLAVLSVRHAEEPALRAKIAAVAVELTPPVRPPEELR